MVTNGDQSGHPEQIDSRRLFLGVGWRLFFFVLCLFLPAGTWSVAKGLGVDPRDVVVCIVCTLYLTSQPRGHRRSDQPPQGDETVGSDLE